MGATRIKLDPIDLDFIQRSMVNRAKLNQELLSKIPGFDMGHNHVKGQTVADYSKSAIGIRPNFKFWA